MLIGICLSAADRVNVAQACRVFPLYTLFVRPKGRTSDEGGAKEKKCGSAWSSLAAGATFCFVAMAGQGSPF